jgi:hypothetical protein
LHKAKGSNSCERPAGSAPRLARPVTRLSRRLAVRRHDEGLLQGRGATVHKAWSYDRMPLELDGQRLEESPALQGMDRPRRLHDGVVFVI